MDESVVRNFEEPRVDVKPSELMRMGIPLVQEAREVYLIPHGHPLTSYVKLDGTGRPCGCALGSAVYAMSGLPTKMSGLPATPPCLIDCADILGIPYSVARQISVLHSIGTPREECADKLEEFGF